MLATFFTVTATALGLEWPIRKGPANSGSQVGTVTKVSTTIFRVYKGDDAAGKVVRKTSTKWNVIKSGKKVGVVKKLSSTKFAFYNLSGKKVGLLKPSGGLWIIHKVIPLAGTSNSVLLILGNADKSYPGAPTLGAGRVLLWN